MLKLLKYQNLCEKYVKNVINSNLDIEKIMKKNVPPDLLKKLNQCEKDVRESIKETNYLIKTIVLDFVENEMNEMEQFIEIVNNIMEKFGNCFWNALDEIHKINNCVLIGNK